MQRRKQRWIILVVIDVLVRFQNSCAFVVVPSSTTKTGSHGLFGINHDNNNKKGGPNARHSSTAAGFSWRNINENSTTTTSIAALVDDTVDYERTRTHERRRESDKPNDTSHHAHYDPSYWTGSTLGDIMSSYSLATAAVPAKTSPTTTTTTTSSSSLVRLYNISHPLDRMLLTANGNVQRLVSSYYDAEVCVIVDSCHPRMGLVDTVSQDISNHNDRDETSLWDRVVHLTVFNQTFCTATSVITVRDRHCQELVESGKIGLGQLFRYLDILPHFQLIQAAPKEQGGFWRIYTLSCPELTCYIHEDFCKNIWNMAPA